jgi:acetolactate synthase-1/2/3 large subunit
MHKTKCNKIISTGVGSHQHWALRNIKLNSDNDILLTSSGHGTMGYDIPALIGASIEKPGHIPLCICGDGSFLMNGFEIIKSAEKDIPLKLLIVKNSSLGIVSSFQKWKFGNSLMTNNFNSGDLTLILKGMGVTWVEYCTNEVQFDRVKSDFINNKLLAALIIECDEKYSVNPMVMAGDSLENPTYLNDR